VPFFNRAPFDETLLDAVLETRPEAVTFHFELPAAPLYDKLKREGFLVISSATTVAEARWLAERGVDAIIAGAVQPLRAKAEAQGCGDFSPLWSGQAVALGSELGAAELTHKFAAEALDRLRSLAD
jgi:hypothetical protein